MRTATVIQSHATFGFCLSGLFRPKLLLVRPGPHRTIKRMLVFDFLQAERPSVTEVTSHTTAFTAIFQLRLGHPSITYKKVFGHHWITFLVTFLSPHASLAVKASNSCNTCKEEQLTGADVDKTSEGFETIARFEHPYVETSQSETARRPVNDDAVVLVLFLL